MQKTLLQFLLMAITTIGMNGCSKKDDNNNNPSATQDKLLLVTNISSSNPITAYVGTLKDLTVKNYTNAKGRQWTQYPFATIYGDYVFVTPNKGGDIIKKYKRQPDGTLSEEGSMTTPSASQAIGIVIESDTRGYCSLQNLGKIAVFNPSTMTITSYIDLTSYALAGATPGPTIMVLRNGKLYVACVQTTNGYTSDKPAQVLIINTGAGNTITSATDSRSNWAGSIDEQGSLFFDEQGDLYVFCVASYGFGGPTQKSGFLRIRKDQTSFDPGYFLNVSDYHIAGIPNNKVDYLQHMHYAGNGILYATGNIYALASNPPNYVTDRTYGSFRVDLAGKTVSKLDLPYSNGYAASVLPFEGKILFGLSTATGVGIYTYDPANGAASASPVVTTQGDPGLILSF